MLDIDIDIDTDIDIAIPKLLAKTHKTKNSQIHGMFA